MTKHFVLKVLKQWSVALVLISVVACQELPTPTPMTTLTTTEEPTLSSVPSEKVLPTSTLPEVPSAGMEETATLIPPTTEPVISTPTSRHEGGLKCVGESYSGGKPPDKTKDLILQINVPLNKNYQPVVDYFNEIAQECDGLGLLGRYAEKLPWREMIGDLPKGIIFYSLPSLEYAKETASSWTDYVDWFAYEISFGDRTPTSEQNNPAQASQMALQFAREHGLVYFVTPGRPMTIQHAEALAQYADAYGLQAYGEQHESPETYLQLVKSTSDKIRKVKPDILLLVAFSTDRPDDDPQVAFEMITQLLGYIDGVFIRTTGDDQSMEKMRTLVNLIRGQ